MARPCPSRKVLSRQLLVRFLFFVTAAGSLCALLALDSAVVNRHAGFTQRFAALNDDQALVVNTDKEVLEQRGEKEEKVEEEEASLNVTKPWAPFYNVSVNNPKMVILLSYQRSGSTMLSQLFNANPDVFYQFEPLDAFYSARYGTAYGWNVPSDITSLVNGTLRAIPPGETKAVGDHLLSLLRCQFERLPVETLVHPYQFMFSTQFNHTAPYIQCLLAQNVSKNKCKERTATAYCGQRFAARPPSRLEDCRLLLLNASDRGVRAAPSVRASFHRQRDCFARLHARSTMPCLNLQRLACNKSALRAVKGLDSPFLIKRLLMQILPWITF